MEEELPFDTIEVLRAGAWRTVRLEDWLATDGVSRVSEISSGGVRFTRSGRMVSLVAALAALRRRKP